jgi:general secretion pathway protein G
MNTCCRGYTLIELLIVMALIAMLLSLSVPRYFGNVDRAKEAVLRQDLAQMRDGIQKYFGDQDRYPNPWRTRGVEILEKVPADVTERDDTWVVIAPVDRDSGKVFDVKWRN